MGKRLTNEELMGKVAKMIPAGMPEWMIQSVEVDVADGFNGYWVYLNDGFVCPSMECKTIHEKTLTALKTKLSECKLWADDPAFEEKKTKTKDKAYWNKYSKLANKNDNESAAEGDPKKEDKKEPKNTKKILTKQDACDKIEA